MCGITGLFDTRGQRLPERERLHRMNESQHHRGPDEGDLHVEPGVGFGHRRLSVIDIATGQQPIFNDDKSVALVFNGEVYNYLELMDELRGHGYVFRTKSDSEAIVRAWEHWGEDCVHHLRGMFAFMIHDRRRDCLFMARDRLGVKPLHYALTEDGWLLFGSELKSLMAHGGLRQEIDPRAVEAYFALGYVPDPSTIYKHAKKLAPGHRLLVKRGQTLGTPQRYWDVK
ncbi:MAG: asparagine synthetase B, partial [Burkholderiales bacterium]|nr:asparagine synthetase B [Burkholderiales bacterium]